MPMPTPGSLRVVAIPPGPSGVEVARGVVEQAFDDTSGAAALVADPGEAVSILRPDLPLEDPRTRLILMTSGSTGDPKGVCWSRDNLMAMTSMWRQAYPELEAAPRIIALPVTSAGGLGAIIRGVLDAAPIVALPSIGGAGRFDAGALRDIVAPLADDGPVISLVPTQLALLLRDDDGRHALRCIRKVFLGGAASPAVLLEEATRLGVDVSTTYGMTETCGGCVHDGIPLDGVDVRIESSGRIHLAGAMCALGYRLRPEETAELFGRTAAGSSYATGDVGAWNNDRLVVLGRIDDIVQVRGYNVALGAVETAITESGLAREAVIMATEDPVDGHRLIGLAIPARDLGSDADAPVDVAAWVQDIAQAVRERLGSAAVPATLTPVSVLPYLSNGKIDRLAVHRALISRDGATGQDETEGMR